MKQIPIWHDLSFPYLTWVFSAFHYTERLHMPSSLECGNEPGNMEVFGFYQRGCEIDRAPVQTEYINYSAERADIFASGYQQKGLKQSLVYRLSIFPE